MTAAVSGDVAHRAFPGMGWRGCGRAGRATAPPFGLSRWGHPILRGTPPPRSAPPVTPTASPAPRSPTPRSPAWPATAHPATPAANRPSVMPRSAASPWPSTTPVVRSKTTERNSSPSIGFTSPERRDQIAHRAAKGSCGGRPPAFDPDLYASRNVVERCFQPAQAVPGSGHPLRQTRRLLPLREHHRVDRGLSTFRCN